MYNVFIDYNINLLDEVLKDIANITLFDGKNLTNKELIDKNCEILFVRSTINVNEQLLRNTNVKFVATATTGIDHIDLAYLNKNNIIFYDAAGSNSNSVAEYVFYVILRWIIENKINFNKLKIGIIGYGRIGKKIANFSHIINAQIFVNDPPLKANNYLFPDYVNYVEIEELLENCNIITNHVPLTYDGNYPTFNLINYNLLKLIKENSLLIHTSRGGVVNEKDLISLLEKVNLSLAIDVWENEPNINCNLVEKCFFATPHIAGYSYNGKLNGSLMMAKYFEEYTKLKPNYDIFLNELNKYKYLLISGNSDFYHIYQKIKNNRLYDLDNDFLKFVCKSNLDIKSEFTKYRKKYPIRYETIIF